MAWCRRHFGPLREGFTGIINRTGPVDSGFSLDDLVSLWGLAHDAWSANGAPRLWSKDSLGHIFVGNPPYSWKDIMRFCERAKASSMPVMGIIPAKAQNRLTAGMVRRSGGRLLAKFRAGSGGIIAVLKQCGQLPGDTADSSRVAG